MPKGKGHRWTPEEKAYLAEITPGRSYLEIYKLCQRRFDWNIPNIQVIKSAIGRYRLNTGRTGRWAKGHVPANKGVKIPPEQYARCKATMFKKGNLPHNTQPIGAEVVASDGYTFVKVSDDYSQPRHINWRPKQQLVWEQAHGEIPKNHIVIFLDGDKQNFNLDNLACISRGTLVRMNQSKLFSEDPEVTKAGITLAKLKNTIGKRKKDIK